MLTLTYHAHVHAISLFFECIFMNTNHHPIRSTHPTHAHLRVSITKRVVGLRLRRRAAGTRAVAVRGHCAILFFVTLIVQARVDEFAHICTAGAFRRTGVIKGRDK